MAQLTKASTTDDLINDYDKGMHPYALCDKYNVSIETVMSLIDSKFKQDEDGNDVVIQKLAEGESPKKV